MSDPERGRLIKGARNVLENDFGKLEGLSKELFRKRTDRVIWELASVVPFESIENSTKTILSEVFK